MVMQLPHNINLNTPRKKQHLISKYWFYYLQFFILSTFITGPIYYKECKIRNMLTTNHQQGEVWCCQIWGRRRKRGKSHEWALTFIMPVKIYC